MYWKIGSVVLDGTVVIPLAILLLCFVALVVIIICGIIAGYFNSIKNKLRKMKSKKETISNGESK